MTRISYRIVLVWLCVLTLPHGIFAQEQSQLPQQPQQAPNTAMLPMDTMQQPGSFPAGGMPAMNGMPPMSEAEFLQMQQELDREITQYVNSLPQEQQEQFYKDVDELTKVMSTMSEEELKQFVEDVFIPMEAAAQQPVAPQEPIKEPVIQKEEKPVEPVKTEGTDKVVKLLNNLITRTERFLLKTQKIPELPGKIEQWISKDKIKEWQIDLTWTTLKSDIEKFDHRLRTIKESVDPKTKKPRYLSDLLKDEVLYNNLSKISAGLTAHEPKVEAPEFGVGHVNKEVRAAIKEVLGVFAEAFYTLNIIEALDTLIALYEPKAKEHREEQEGHRKKALEESKKGRSQAAKREASTPSKGGGRPGGEFPQEYYPGGQPGGYGGYPGGAYDYGQAAHPSEYGEQGIEKAGSDKKSASEREKSKTGEKPKELEKESSALNDQIKSINNALEKIADLIEDSPNFKKLADHVTNPATPLDKDLIESAIPRTTRAFKKVTKEVKAFKLGLTRVSQKESYIKQLRVGLEEHKKLFAALEKQLREVEQRKSTISTVKQYAYLGDDSKHDAALKENPKLDEMIRQPAHIDELLEALRAFNTEIEFRP